MLSLAVHNHCALVSHEHPNLANGCCLSQFCTGGEKRVWHLQLHKDKDKAPLATPAHLPRPLPAECTDVPPDSENGNFTCNTLPAPIGGECPGACNPGNKGTLTATCIGPNRWTVCDTCIKGIWVRVQSWH